MRASVEKPLFQNIWLQERISSQVPKSIPTKNPENIAQCKDFFYENPGIRARFGEHILNPPSTSFELPDSLSSCSRLEIELGFAISEPDGVYEKNLEAFTSSGDYNDRLMAYEYLCNDHVNFGLIIRDIKNYLENLPLEEVLPLTSEEFTEKLIKLAFQLNEGQDINFLANCLSKKLRRALLVTIPLLSRHVILLRDKFLQDFCDQDGKPDKSKAISFVERAFQIEIEDKDEFSVDFGLFYLKVTASPKDYYKFVHKDHLSKGTILSEHNFINYDDSWLNGSLILLNNEYSNEIDATEKHEAWHILFDNFIFSTDLYNKTYSRDLQALEKLIKKPLESREACLKRHECIAKDITSSCLFGFWNEIGAYIYGGFTLDTFSPSNYFGGYFFIEVRNFLRMILDAGVNDVFSGDPELEKEILDIYISAIKKFVKVVEINLTALHYAATEGSDEERYKFIFALTTHPPTRIFQLGPIFGLTPQAFKSLLIEHKNKNLEQLNHVIYSKELIPIYIEILRKEFSSNNDPKTMSDHVDFLYGSILSTFDCFSAEETSFFLAELDELYDYFPENEDVLKNKIYCLMYLLEKIS